MSRLFSLPLAILLAILLISPLLAQVPDPFDTHIRTAQTAVRSGLPVVAAREYRAALMLHPSDAAACYALAGVLEQAGRTDEAIAEYRETIRLRPDNAPAHNSLAALLEEKGQTAAALAQYRQALVLEPNNALLHYNLAGAYDDAGDHRAALAEYQTALRLKPDFPEARDALAEAMKASPPAPSIPQAVALEAAGRLDEAVAAFRAVLASHPNDESTRLHLGIALYINGQTDLARSEWQHVLTHGDARTAAQARRLLAKDR